MLGILEAADNADRSAGSADHAAAAAAENAEFLEGTNIEDVPLPDGHVDAVISNCVVNLSGCRAGQFRDRRPGVGGMTASPVSGGCVYAGVAEHSAYVRPGNQGRGSGERCSER